MAAFIVTTVPEHFLEDHLWKHVVREHALRVFLWTLGSLLVLHLVVERWEVGGALDQGRWIMLLVAGLVGLVPESGPHLIFVTMYAEGLVPFGVLLTSSIVQDGHVRDELSGERLTRSNLVAASMGTTDEQR